MSFPPDPLKIVTSSGSTPPGRPVVHIDSPWPDARIALWLDADEAEALAELYGPDDLATSELLRAIELAYPETDPSEGAS